MRAFGTLGIIGLIGVVLGAVSWGLVGLFDYNLVEEIVGTGTAADVVYIIIGVTGILALGAVVWALGVITRGGAGSILALLGAVAVVIAVIGAINWGLVGLFEYNLVEEIFGTATAADAVYIIVGVAGLLTIPTLIGAWGFRSGERRLETSSETLELRRALDEGRRRDEEFDRSLTDARARDEELGRALDESRRRDEEFARALDEGRRRDEELSRRLEEMQAPAAHGPAAGLAPEEEDAYARDRVSELHPTDRATEPYATERPDEAYVTERASEPTLTREGEAAEREEETAREETSVGAGSERYTAETYTPDAEERFEESFAEDERYETGLEPPPTDEEADGRREAA